MKKLPQTPKEQQAEAFWKDFDPDKEKGFWTKYEALLSGIKHQSSVVAASPGALQKFSLSSANYIAFGVYMLLCLGTFYLVFMACVEEDIFQDLFRVKGGQFWLIIIIIFASLALFGVSVIGSISWLIKVRTFVASESGLFVFSPLTPKKKLYMEWIDIERIDLEGIRDGNNQLKGCGLKITTANQGIKVFDYSLTKQNHKNFFHLLEQENIKVTSIRAY